MSFILALQEIERDGLQGLKQNGIIHNTGKVFTTIRLKSKQNLMRS